VIETFFKEKKTQKILEGVAEQVSNSNYKNIAGLIQDLEKAVTFSLHMDIGLDLVEDVGEALKRLNETHVPIPSALADIRGWTNEDRKSGGWYRGSISVFVGMPNVGKTLQLCNEASFSYMKGYNVLYITLELTSELVWEKIAVNVTGIPLSEIRKKSESEIKEPLKNNTVIRERIDASLKDKFENLGDKKGGSLTVRQMLSSTNAQDIENLIHEVEIAKGIQIDLLCIDYLQKVKPIGASAMHNSSLYSQGKDVVEQCRDIALKREIAVLTASQLNRDGYSNKHADMANIAGSAAISDTADLMVTITEDPYLKKHQLFMHMIIKNRFGPNMIAFISHVDWSFMRVRTADNQIVNQYRESQLNSNIEITNFNRDQKENPEATPVVQEKQEKEHDRFETIRRELEAREKSKDFKGEDFGNIHPNPQGSEVKTLSGKDDKPIELSRIDGIKNELEKKRLAKSSTDTEIPSKEIPPKNRWDEMQKVKNGI
jgi:hypothetical protein